MPEVTAERLSGLIAAIYDRAIDPGNWPDTLGDIRVLIGAENAALSLIDLRQNAFMLNFLDNVPEAWSRQIERWGGEIINAWGGVELFRTMSLDEPFIWSRAIPETPRDNSFVEEVTSKGIGDSMSLVLARDDHVVGACGFGRMRQAGAFSKNDLSVARLLLPHMQRSIAFSRMLELATLRAAAFEAALDALAVPTILVTDRLQIVHANRAAQVELDRGQAMRLADGRLAACDVRQTGRLKQALTAARDRPDAAPGTLDVALDAGSGRLKLLPLPRGSVRGTLAPSATAAIVLEKPAEARRADPGELAARLIEAHRLTRAEAAVALEIAKGDGRAAAAGRLGLSENTVRTHLSAIFHKLGVNRQAQLARLVDEAAAGL